MKDENTPDYSDFLAGQDERDDQDEVVEQLAKGASTVESDPTRSTLHTGEDEDGEGGWLERQEGSGDAMRPDGGPSVQNTARPDSATSTEDETSRLDPASETRTNSSAETGTGGDDDTEPKSDVEGRAERDPIEVAEATDSNLAPERSNNTSQSDTAGADASVVEEPQSTATPQATEATAATPEVGEVEDTNTAPSSLQLDPERPDVPPDVPQAGDTVTLGVRLAGEAFRGNPDYEIIVDGMVVARGTVDWARETTTEGRYDLVGARDEVEWRDVTVDLTMPANGFQDVQVRFPNDKYHAGVGDRNLLVDRISMNGQIIEAEHESVDYDGGRYAKGVTSERLPWQGKLNFDVETIFDDMPPTKGPEGAYIIEGVEGAVIGQLTVTDPDEEDSHSFEVSDERFEVVNGTLRLKDGISLDHDEAGEVDINVTVTDAAGGTLTETFTVQVLNINLAPDTVNLSETEISKTDPGAVVGTISVIDPDADDSHSFEVSDDRFEVVDGELRLKEGVSLADEPADHLDIQITATDTGGLSVSETFSVDVVALPQITVQSGFHARYFDVDHALSEMDDVDWSAVPTHQDIKSNIDFTDSHNSFWEDGATDTFAVQINGNIEVTEAGTFDFHLSGDDGAMLYINGKSVIAHDGLHVYTTRSGEIELDPGTHHIEVRYFENYGVAGLNLEWEGPGIEGRAPVTSPDITQAQTVGGVPIALNIEVDHAELTDDSTLLLEGLPAGTILSAGDETVEVNGDGVADISGWPVNLLTVTPPTGFSGVIQADLIVEIDRGNGNNIRNMEPIEIQVNELPFATPEAALENGFHARYYEFDGASRNIDDIDWDAAAAHEEVVRQIDYENGAESFWEGGARDTFGARITGDVTVEEGGAYTFFVGGDDGVVLFVNGEEVVDNDGDHGFRTRTGEVELPPGTHEIELRYFENFGRAGLRLEWEGPGTEGRELVQADPEITVGENGAVALGIDLDGASDSATVQIVGLPADTILMSGEDSAISDGGPINVSDWNVELIEFSMPPGYEGTVSGEILITDTAYNGSSISSSNPFEITVGDPAMTGGTEDERIEDHVFAERSDGDGSWDADTAAADDDDNNEDDVMSEQAVAGENNHGSDIDVETYERADW